VLRNLALLLTTAVMALTAVPGAQADNTGQCQYPGVGTAGNVVGGFGGFCDFPTEINGSHWHCEGGGFSATGGGAFSGGNGATVTGGGLLGAGGASCTWRCPDNTLAPAPNPPGAWKQYLRVMDSTNFCKNHMTPAGFWGDPVLPTEGQPTGEEPPLAPGEPNP
jgi:hypothetical protein